MKTSVRTKMLLQVLTLGYFAGVFGADDFDKIVDDFWQWRLMNNPEFASNIGDSRYTDKVEDYSLEAIENRKTDIDNFLQRLSSVNKNSLSSAEHVTFEVLKGTIQTWADGYKWRFYGPMNPVSILEGIQTNYGSRAEQVKFEREEDFKMFAQRIFNYGEQIDQIIVRMKKAIEMGTTYHRASIEKVPSQLNEIYTLYMSNRTAFPMFKPFQDRLDVVLTNVTTTSNIRKVADDNIKVLLNQIKKMADFITNTYMLNTRSTFGVEGFPQGLDYYKACLKWQLSVDMTPDEIHEKGISEVNRVNREIQNIVRRANFNGTVREYNDYLRQNESLFISNGDEALQKFKDIYQTMIVPELHKLFDDIPDSPLQIEKMPYNGPAGIYKNAAPDGSRPGVFLANVHSKVPKFDMKALLLHESDPGHHLQDSYAQASNNIPLFRKVTDFSKYFAVPLHFPFYTGYSEGWGLYSEDLGEEMDMYKNDLERYGKYGLEIFRAARLVVDTGIHAKSWTRDHAIEYMKNYTAFAPEMIAREIDRYSTWPAQATTYMIGKIKIQELREKAEDSLCNLFDIKAFHSIIIGNGAMPLSVLENEVDKWIEKQTNENIDRCGQIAGVEQIHNTQIVVVIFCSIIALVC
ncbi:uncharacterized protein LOC132730537 isoform X2 [Ruditapes philippinarum]|uniref:uncharacterized protein LOC132730537 isoform X2 n=1 Tax=Ruditapes philippinarum TaxID=129788 RepID=UPI00295ADEC5|nr:uncharacterized protein LOC132730537 isoform X2 [Ruditapes philippinarum]